MDDERLKNPPVQSASPAPDYFDDLPERIRDIRASERRMYLRVREIFKLAADYEPSSKNTVQFFRVLQWVLRKQMTNQSLRKRFGLSENSGNTVSQIISATLEQGLVKVDPNAPESKRYARYIPVWA